MAGNPTGSGLAEGNTLEDESISLTEYMEAERHLEDDAIAVLGGSDTRNCTYKEVCTVVGVLTYLRTLPTQEACESPVFGHLPGIIFGHTSIPGGQ